VNQLEAATRRILDRLDTLRIERALVGELAVSARVEPRFTRDIDLCTVVEDDAQAERLVRRLRDDGYEVGALLEQEDVGRIAAVRLMPAIEDPSGVVVGLLFASSGVEAEVVAGSDPLELFGAVVAPVASVGALIALKLLSADDQTRPQDRVDLVALMGIATTTHLAEAAQLCALIEARGYARGRDLTEMLRTLRAGRP
jgi:hypothetical protein